MCKALTPFPGVHHISIPLPSSMRLIRAQLLPNHNHGLRKLLQPLVGGVYEGRGSAGILTHRCGRFFSTVAVASSDDAKNVHRKRLPKRERRIMVESFVNEYRSLNGGKFPTITDAQKEVGGSFYIIREIMQDLEYNFVHNPGARMSEKLLVEKKGTEDIKIPKRGVSRDQEVSCSHNPEESSLFEVQNVLHDDVKVLSDNADIGAEKTAYLEVAEEVDGPPLPVSLQGDLSTINERTLYEGSERVTNIGHSDHLSDDGINKDVESRKMVDSTNISGRTSMEDKENPRRKEDKDEILARSTSVEVEGRSSVPLTSERVLVDEKDAKSGQGLVKPGISTLNTTDDQITHNYDGSRETSKENSKDDDAQVNPSIWSNIKSFADSILRSWRKR